MRSGHRGRSEMSGERLIYVSVSNEIACGAALHLWWWESHDERVEMVREYTVKARLCSGGVDIKVDLFWLQVTETETDMPRVPLIRMLHHGTRYLHLNK